MNYMTKKSVLNRVNEHLTHINKNEEVLAILLKGSQNYMEDLFLKDSDIDTVALTVPSPEEVLLGEVRKNKVITLDNDEQVTVIDIRTFIKSLGKPSFTNYELLYTKYSIVNEEYQEFFSELLTLREELVRHNEKTLLFSIYGVSTSEHKRLIAEDRIDGDFGYSKKSLANLLRLNASAKAYKEGKDYYSVLTAFPQERIKELREEGVYSKEEALKIAEKVNEETKMLALNAEKPNLEASEIIKAKLKKLKLKLMYKTAEKIDKSMFD